jgi:hypothetical protein
MLKWTAAGTNLDEAVGQKANPIYANGKEGVLRAFRDKG